MSISRPLASSAQGGAASKEKKKKRLPRLEDFLANRDYVGAITFLEVHKAEGSVVDWLP